MAFKSPDRNFDGVQFSDLRKTFDANFNEASDELSAAYYDHWRQGDYSVAFQGHRPRVSAAREEAKALFDKLHGLIFYHYDVMFHNANQLGPDPYPEDDYNDIKNKDGSLKERKNQTAQGKIDQLALEDLEIIIA